MFFPMTQPRNALVLFLIGAQLLFAALSVAVHRTRPQGLIAIVHEDVRQLFVSFASGTCA